RARISNCHLLPLYCHIASERLGATAHVRARSVDCTRRLNLLQKWSLLRQSCARRAGRRPREKTARSGSNGSFFGCFYCQLAMLGSYPKPGPLVVYDARSSPRGLPFRGFTATLVWRSFPVLP